MKREYKAVERVLAAQSSELMAKISEVISILSDAEHAFERKDHLSVQSWIKDAKGKLIDINMALHKEGPQ